MSKDPKSPPPDYEVGYGRPPRQTRFKKGQSGNPKGRPKVRGGAEVDVADLRIGLVTITQDGVARKMPAKEVELRKILAKAIKGDMRSIKYLLEQFEKYKAVRPQPRPVGGGVAKMPKSMPFDMGVLMFRKFGPPPWSKREVNEGRAMSVGTHGGAQLNIDESGEHDDHGQ